MRSSIVSSGSPGSGGRPRPSLKWQPLHDRALKSGPRPSRPATDAGAMTQLRLKNELPTKNDDRCSSRRFRAGSEKALRELSKTVPSPPDSASPGDDADPSAATNTIDIAVANVFPCRERICISTNNLLEIQLQAERGAGFRDQ